MTLELDFLYTYLNSEKIAVDKDEFDFQFKSHPSHPSLLALTDTLTFFNLTNGALQISSDQLHQLPENFVAVLKNDSGKFLSHVRRKEKLFSYSTNDHKQSKWVSKDTIEKLWQNVIVLVENDEQQEQPKKGKTPKNWLFLIPLLILISSLVYFKFSNFKILLFYLFPLAGIVLSIVSLGPLFNTKNTLIKRICKSSESFDCETIVHSKGWKIFEIINFSDLSLVFFSSQFLSLFLFIISKNHTSFFNNSVAIFIVLALVSLSSLYYQKFVIKKWCPICLLIILTLVFEFVYVFFVMGYRVITIDGISLLVLTSIFSGALILWKFIKEIITTKREQERLLFSANRFKRNYTNFKTILTSNRKYILPKNPIAFGNENAKLTIDFITSPYCKYCAEPDRVFKDIISKYGNQVNLRITYCFNILESKRDDQKQLLRNLVYLKLNENNTIFDDAFNDWLHEKNHEKWFAKYNQEFETKPIDAVLEKHYKWCSTNKFTFTPCVFVNGYLFPSSYDVQDIRYFIEDLIQDKDFGSSK